MNGFGVVIGQGGATEAFAFETLTATNGAAVGTNDVLCAGASRAVFTFEAGSARFRYDGSAPTTTVGHLVAISAGNTVSVIVEGAQNIVYMQIIATTATNSTISVTYEK